HFLRRGVPAGADAVVGDAQRVALGGAQALDVLHDVLDPALGSDGADVVAAEPVVVVTHEVHDVGRLLEGAEVVAVTGVLGRLRGQGEGEHLAVGVQLVGHGGDERGVGGAVGGGPQVLVVHLQAVVAAVVRELGEGLGVRGAAGVGGEDEAHVVDVGAV